jgi:capsular exopolysaccharide synthesis family protein
MSGALSMQDQLPERPAAVSRLPIARATGDQPIARATGERPRPRPAPAAIDAGWGYAETLFAHKRALLACAAAGLAVALLIGFAQAPQYRGRTSLEIQNFNDNFLNLNSVDPTVSGVDLPLGPSYLQTQVVMLQSDTLLERVIDRLDLRQATPPRFARLRAAFGWPAEPQPPSMEQLLRQTKANLTVRAARDTRIAEIQFSSHDPQIAAGFANTLVGAFIEQSQEMRVRAFQRIAERLTAHLTEMKGKLESAEAQLQDYVRTSGLTFTSEKDNVSDVRLIELQEELSRAEADRIAKEARFEQARTTAADALPDIIDDPTLREYRLRLTDLQRQLVELTATLMPAHYKVRRVQAQIDELHAAIRNARTLTLSRIESEYAAARRREAFLSNAYADQLKVVTDQSGKSIRYRTLRGEVDSTRRLYEAMLERVKQAELAMTMSASNLLVIDPAQVPTRPYSPNLPMNAAVGLFGGVFIGLGLVLWRDRVDRRIKAPGEARVYLDVAELGVITRADCPPRQLTATTRSLRRALRLPADSSSAPAGATLVPLDAGPSVWTDGYSGIVTSMLLVNPTGDIPQVVVVTSPASGDGKTTIARNLGLAVGETGKRVLLVDADLRRPRLHQLFGLPDCEGLGELLCADSPIDRDTSLARSVQATPIPGVSILPAGSNSLRGARLLHSARMAVLLERLRGEFDMVVVDTPPVIAVPDARALGRLADGVILVIRAGHTTLESAMAARERFADDGTRVLGTVLNGWNPKMRGRSSGRYYAGYES